jgi:hypothetical protein
MPSYKTTFDRSFQRQPAIEATQMPKHRGVVNRRLCFILMSFREQLEPVHKAIREAVVLDNGLVCERADDIYSAGIVIDEIWIKLCEAQIVIADVTGRNANVLYEMGLAHAIGKEVVILAQATSDIPFDLQHRRVILYDPERLDQLRIRLASTIERLRWKRPDIKQWLDASRKDIRVGLSSPVDGAVVNHTPIESAGQVVGLPPAALRHRIQAFVTTDREYEQGSAWIDQDGFWAISQIHLGAREHQLLFRIYDESGRLLSASSPIKVILEGVG